MQQTENYKLNKPEMSDPFSPNPLSENMDVVDAALADVTQRVIKLEGCRIIVGTYQKYSGNQIIDLGGRPAAVLITGRTVGSPLVGFVVGNQVSICGSGSTKPCLWIVDNGFEVLEYAGAAEETYGFMAIMGDWEFLDVPKYVAP